MMNRNRILVLMGVLVVAAVLAIPAGAGRATHTTSTQKVFRSMGCQPRINPYFAPTWACTTVTVNPWQATSGDTTSVTYTFKAKKALKFVNVCFGKITTGAKAQCAYSHKFRKLRKGRVIKSVLQLSVPEVTMTGDYKFDNYTRFYKRQKSVSTKLAYWTANSYMCIVSSSQPGTQCSG